MCATSHIQLMISIRHAESGLDTLLKTQTIICYVVLQINDALGDSPPPLPNICNSSNERQEIV